MKSHRQLHKYCMQVRSRQTCISLWSHSDRTQLWRYFAGNSKIPIRSIHFIAKIIPRLTLFWIPFEFLRTSYITKSKYQGYLVSLNQHSLRSTERHPLPSSDFEQVLRKQSPCSDIWDSGWLCQGPECVPLPGGGLLVPMATAKTGQPRCSHHAGHVWAGPPLRGGAAGGWGPGLGPHRSPRQQAPAEGRSWFLLRLQLSIHQGSHWRSTEKLGK